MARNRIWIDASVERVFEVLGDPYAYQRWVVGTRRIVEADKDWPEAGSRFSYRTGRPPLHYSGTTRVLQVDPPRRLLLKTDLPTGPIDIEIDLQGDGGRTRVELSETAPRSSPRSLIDAALHLRNWQALSRLKAVVEEKVTGLEMRPLHVANHWLDDPRIAEVVAQAERCYVAVATKSGPHVTPAAFTSMLGRIWIVTHRKSLKARTIARETRVGVTIRGVEQSIVIWGRATVIDPKALWIPRDFVERLYAGPAVARYFLDNQRRLGGFALAPSSIVELNPLNRVLLSIAPDRIARVEGPEVVDRRGAFPRGRVPNGSLDHLPKRAGVPLDLEGAPDAVSGLADGSRAPAALGWQGDSGPIALPAIWHGDRNLVSVPAVLLTEGIGRAGLCLDSDVPGELDEQVGMLVRGDARVVGTRGGYAAVAIDGDKTTTWEAAESGTVNST